jgi:energy-coupling factor transporter transmembrane protein EcfT
VSTRIAELDRWAAAGTSRLHRASPLAKWLLLLSAVVLAVMASAPWPLLAGYVTLVLVAAASRLPLRALVVASLLPVPLVGLYAVSRWDGTLTTPLSIMGKGMVTAMAGLLVAASTPFHDLLAPATRVLPPVLGDSLVLTYRAIFILAARVEALWLAIRARGGFFRRPAPGALPWPARGTSVRRRVEVGTMGLALAVLRGADLSTRLYDVMRLRGYRGRLAPARPLGLAGSDWPVLLVAAGLVALGVISNRTL